MSTDLSSAIHNVQLDTKSINHIAAKSKLRLGNWMAEINAGSEEAILELYLSASLDQPEFGLVNLDGKSVIIISGGIIVDYSKRKRRSKVKTQSLRMLLEMIWLGQPIMCVNTMAERCVC